MVVKINLNVKKIKWSKLIIGAMLCIGGIGIGFSDDKEVSSGDVINQNSGNQVAEGNVISSGNNQQNTIESKSYYVVIENNKYRVIASENSHTTSDKYFKNQKDAEMAGKLGIDSESDFNGIVNVARDAPYGTNYNLLVSNGYPVSISVDGYVSTAESISLKQGVIEQMNEAIGKGDPCSSVQVQCSANPTPQEQEDAKKTLEQDILKLQQEIKTDENIFNKNPPSVEMQGEILSKLNDEDREELVNAINDEKCGDSWLGALCDVFLSDNAYQLIEKSFYESIENFNYNPNLMDENGNPISEKDQYNQYLYNELKSNTNVFGESESCNNYDDCKKIVDRFENSESIEIAVCEEEGLSTNCEVWYRNNLNEAEKLLRAAQKLEKIETNWLYSAFDAIRNQDAGAKDSARFFGFGANYEDLPRWLQEQGFAASQICIGEIDGYLDDDGFAGGKTIESEDGLTKYGYNTTTSTVSTLYDLRAKRTRIMPDNSTSITLSLYLNAPKSVNLEYMVGISYKAGDRVEKEILINKSSITGGDSVSDFFTYDILVKNRAQIYEGSFMVHFKAKTESGQVFADDKANIYLITVGDDNRVVKVDGVEVSGNNEGNYQDSTNDDLEEDSDIFWDNW